MDLCDIKTIKKSQEFGFLKKANVNAVSIGYKKVQGKETPQLCIVVGVSKKLPENQLCQNDIITKSLDGVPIDIVELGNIKALSIDPTQKYRPLMPGISVGHPNITAGSIGCIAYKNGKAVILSNNHVISDVNNAKIGDPIIQPGNFDGGTSADKMGELLEFIPINMGLNPINPPSCNVLGIVSKVVNFVAEKLNRNHRLAVVNSQAAFNEVDAAIATIEVDYDKSIPDIGIPIGIKEPELGMEVQKFGRTTSYTKGKIEQMHATVNVGYDAGQMAIFQDQIIMGPISAGGDSGSSINSMDNYLVGLLFAGSDQVTIASPMSKVFKLLGISLNY